MYILTGGAGFIGSVTLKTLNENGITDILLVDNLRDSAKWKNLVGKSFADYIDKNSFLKLIDENKLLPSVKAIIHLGACTSTVERNAEYMMQNNYQYSKRLCRFALDNDIRFIYASSAATYGNGHKGFSDEHSNLQNLAPLNIYAYSKHAFDLWLLQNNLLDKVSGIKFFNVFGPNEYHKGEMTSVIFKSYQQILETGAVKLFKSHKPDYRDGEQKRDFIYVKDCAKVIFWLVENQSVTGIFNLGTGTARTWNDLVGAVFSALNRPPEVNYIDMPINVQKHYQYFTEADMKKLTLHGLPIKFTPLENAISDYVAYLASSAEDTHRHV